MSFNSVLYCILYALFLYYSCVPISNVSTTTCTMANYETYLINFTSLQSQEQALNVAFQNIESLNNQYCRSYLETALCASIYPPCNDTGDSVIVQGLCPDECTKLLLNTTQCSSTTFVACDDDFLSRMLSSFEMPPQQSEVCFSILDNAGPPNT